MIRLVGVVLAAVATIGSVAFADESKTPPETIHKLTESDNGKTIKVKMGEVVRILLKGNPTTGYSWRTGKLDGKSIEQKGEAKYTTNPHPRGMVGVGGMFVFTFKAAKPGTTEVNLEYARPWEKGKKPVKSFTTTIDVQEK
jgi:inhibitor of cysteine peptidase